MKQNISLILKTAAVSMTFALLAACSGATTPADTSSDTAPTAAVETAADTESADTGTMTDTTAADTGAMTDTEETSDGAEVAAVENTKLNLNEASGDAFLAAIPDFSGRMVREFEEYRPYISIQQFRQEIGKYVDEATVAVYEEYVYVPVDVNESDAETLMQLPGVDESVAEVLMDARPYDSNDAFLTALADQVSPEDASAAAGYLAQ